MHRGGQKGLRVHNFVCQKTERVPNTMFLTPKNPKNPMPWALATKNKQISKKLGNVDKSKNFLFYIQIFSLMNHQFGKNL